MLINKLRDYYGFPGSEEQTFINRVTRGMSESRQDELADIVIQNCQKKYGFPDVARLSKFIKAEEPQSGTGRFYWAVCDECGAEYDYRFMHCPVCFLCGKKDSRYKVRTSTEGIPGKVIRWNILKLEDDGAGTYCVTCANRDNGYCRWFGAPDHTCKQNEFEYCACKKCCASHKKANAQMPRAK